MNEPSIDLSCSTIEQSEDDHGKEKNKDISEIYNIFKEVYSKAPAILKDLKNPSVDIDYKECINDLIDFKRIKNKFQNEEYTSVTDIMKDIRLVFLNCYKFYGINNENTGKSLKVEQLLEEKINSLDANLKLLASTELTFNLLNMEVNQNYKFRYPKNYYDSELLRAVAHCRPERLKEYHKILSNTLTTDEDKAHTLEEIISWENEIFFNDNYQYISAMWELPEIGNFLAIIFKEFNLDIINQGEIERMFLIPKESSSMSNVMTILLMPIKKTKYVGQLMPYKIWSEKLSKKISEWYKIYHMKKRNKVNVVKLLGIHPDFWAVMGEKNPLDDCDYCELSYFMKVWLVKGLCDYVTNKYKTINDIITNCMERQCTIWKNDLETEEYFFFNSMPDLRIYYQNIPNNEPNLEFLESEKPNKEVMEKEDVLLTSDMPSVFHSRARVKPNENNFKLIANSVQGLRSFLEKLNFEDSSVPESLIQALEDFIVTIEPQEYNYIVLENNSKIKLFKDWKTYTERCLEEKEKTLFWEEKELKPLSEDIKENVVQEKRIRKAVVKQGFDFDVKFDSDEYYSESEEYLSELTDSEDEWGFINQPKSKAKSAIQTSKLVEFEKRLKKENKSSNQCKNKLFDHNENKKLSKIKNKSLYNKQNEINSFTDKSVDIKSIDTINMEIEISGDEKMKKKVLINECEEQEKIVPIRCKNNEIKTLLKRKKRKFVVENNSFISIPDTKRVKIDVSKNVDTVVIDNNLNSCEIPNNDTSETLISNDSVCTNKQVDCISIKPTEFNSNKNNEVIFIDDDDDIDKVNAGIIISDDDNKNNEIIISDDEDDVQIISVTSKPHSLPVKINRSYSLNKSHNFTPINRQKKTTDTSGYQAACTSIPKLSPNISIIPANVHLPKGIEVTMVKQPQSIIPSHFNTLKRSTVRSNGHLKNNNSIVNVECKVISKPNLNGEVKFYVSLPNGKLHPVSDMLMNQYLKEHNNILPDYWMVPLPVDVAKQYGFY